MATKLSRKRYIRLDHTEKETGVVVTPESEDRFALTMELAIRGCALSSQIDKLNEQIGSLLEMLHLWISEHSYIINQAYVALRDTGLLFLVVQKGKRFDPALEDELTELDIGIAQSEKFDLLNFSVLALPECGEEAVKSFLTRKSTLEYEHAERDDPPGDSKP